MQPLSRCNFLIPEGFNKQLLIQGSYFIYKKKNLLIYVLRYYAEIKNVLFHFIYKQYCINIIVLCEVELILCGVDCVVMRDQSSYKIIVSNL
jgi:hypothetical protein